MKSIKKIADSNQMIVIEDPGMLWELNMKMGQWLDHVIPYDRIFISPCKINCCWGGGMIATNNLNYILNF